MVHEKKSPRIQGSFCLGHTNRGRSARGASQEVARVDRHTCCPGAMVGMKSGVVGEGDGSYCRPEKELPVPCSGTPPVLCLSASLASHTLKWKLGPLIK